MNQHLHAGPRVNLFKQEAEQEELGTSPSPFLKMTFY